MATSGTGVFIRGATACFGGLSSPKNVQASCPSTFVTLDTTANHLGGKGVCVSLTGALRLEDPVDKPLSALAIRAISRSSSNGNSVKDLNNNNSSTSSHDGASASPGQLGSSALPHPAEVAAAARLAARPTAWIPSTPPAHLGPRPSYQPHLPSPADVAAAASVTRATVAPSYPVYQPQQQLVYTQPTLPPPSAAAGTIWGGPSGMLLLNQTPGNNSSSFAAGNSYQHGNSTYLGAPAMQYASYQVLQQQPAVVQVVQGQPQHATYLAAPSASTQQLQQPQMVQLVRAQGQPAACTYSPDWLAQAAQGMQLQQQQQPATVQLLPVQARYAYQNQFALATSGPLDLQQQQQQSVFTNPFQEPVAACNIGGSIQPASYHYGNRTAVRAAGQGTIAMAQGMGIGDASVASVGDCSQGEVFFVAGSNGMLETPLQGAQGAMVYGAYAPEPQVLATQPSGSSAMSCYTACTSLYTACTGQQYLSFQSDGPYNGATSVQSAALADGSYNPGCSMLYGQGYTFVQENLGPFAGQQSLNGVGWLN